MTQDNSNDPQLSSSPCMASETDPGYHGFLSDEEIVAFLPSLLHAERAGTKVCLISQKQAPTNEHKKILQDILEDEQKSCNDLLSSLKLMNATADNVVGDFADKCLAIDDFVERLRFLNRGQAWVVRKIEENIARMANPKVQEQLRVMLEAHRENIDKLDRFLARAL